MAVSCGALLLLTNMAPYYHAETKPRWDIAAKILARDVAPGDVVYLYDTGALPLLRIYLPPGTQTVVLNDSDGDLSHAAQAVSQGKRVWAVYGHAGQSADQKGWSKFYDAARVLGTPAKIQEAGKRIFIALYNPTNTDHGVALNCTLIAMPPHVQAICG